MIEDIVTTVCAELAQSAERTTLNRVVVGSIPTFGDYFSFSFSYTNEKYVTNVTPSLFFNINLP